MDEIIKNGSPEWKVLEALRNSYDPDQGSHLYLIEINEFCENLSETEVNKFFAKYIIVLELKGLFQYTYCSELDKCFLKFTPEGFEFWEKHRLENEIILFEQWQTINVENHEQVAGDLDNLVSRLDQNNEYSLKYPKEAEYTIEICKICSASLKEENNGKVLYRVLEQLYACLVRLKSIFNGVNEIIEIVQKLLKFITPLF